MLESVQVAERPETPHPGLLLTGEGRELRLERALNARRDLWLGRETAEPNRAWAVRWLRSDDDAERSRWWTLARIGPEIPYVLAPHEARAWTERVLIWICPYRADGALRPEHVRETDSGAVNWERLRTFVLHISTALEEMHARGWVHTAVRPSNLFVQTTPELKFELGDLRHARPEGAAQLRVVPDWAPPEWAHVLTQDTVEKPVLVHVHPPVDWWALGLTLLTLIDRHPWAGRADLASFLPHVRPDAVLRNRNLPDAWRQLLRGLLTPDPDYRWGSRQVKAWLSGDQHIPILDAQPFQRWEFAGNVYFSLDDLAEAAINAWSEALDWFFEQGNVYRVLAVAPPDVQRRASEVLLASDRSPDARLAELLGLLNPNLPLAYRGRVFTNPNALRDFVAWPENQALLQAMQADRIFSAYFRARADQRPYGLPTDDPNWLRQLEAWEQTSGPPELFLSLITEPEYSMLAPVQALLDFANDFFVQKKAYRRLIERLRQDLANPPRRAREWRRLIERYQRLRQALQTDQEAFIPRQHAELWARRLIARWERLLDQYVPIMPSTEKLFARLEKLIKKAKQEGLSPDLLKALRETNRKLDTVFEKGVLPRSRHEAIQHQLAIAHSILQHESPWSTEARNIYKNLYILANQLQKQLESSTASEEIQATADQLAAELQLWHSLPESERVDRATLRQHWQAKRSLVTQALTQYHIPVVSIGYLKAFRRQEIPEGPVEPKLWERIHKRHARADKQWREKAALWWPYWVIRVVNLWILLSWVILAVWTMAWASISHVSDPVWWSAASVTTWGLALSLLVLIDHPRKYQKFYFALIYFLILMVTIPVYLAIFGPRPPQTPSWTETYVFIVLESFPVIVWLLVAPPSSWTDYVFALIGALFCSPLVGIALVWLAIELLVSGSLLMLLYIPLVLLSQPGSWLRLVAMSLLFVQSIYSFYRFVRCPTCVSFLTTNLFPES
ncbi:MAG: hypothetical protein GXO36_01015 [Chloroflexi bacterium]|nr:hypothetical protein [Chloroflexota bacterium]